MDSKEIFELFKWALALAAYLFCITFIFTLGVGAALKVLGVV